MLIKILLAAVLTCLIETPIIYLVLRKHNIKNIILNTILINLITNLSLNILNLSILIFLNSYLKFMLIIILELIIPIIEAYMFHYCYNKIKMRTLLLLSYMANCCSFLLGLLLL